MTNRQARTRIDPQQLARITRAAMMTVAAGAVGPRANGETVDGWLDRIAEILDSDELKDAETRIKGGAWPT